MELYSDYTRYLVAVDCIVFGYDILEKELKLLLIKRSFNPMKGSWSLPGGFVVETESLDEAASRILRIYTGLDKIYLSQSYTYGDTERDPGARVISTAYCALIAIRDITREMAAGSEAHWRSIAGLPGLIFDHYNMIARALSDLQNQIKIKPVGFELLPEKFTLVQLQDLYEAIFRKNIDKRNFRKKILSMSILEKLEEKEKKTSRKGAFYFKFNKERYEKLALNGFFFSLDVS